MRVTLPRVILTTLVLLASAFPVVGWSSASAMSPAVVINEFVSSNITGLADNSGAFEDWIELHNTSSNTIDLLGWTIADGSDVHTFPSLSVPANGYRVVFASGDVGRSTSAVHHLPFKLSADGEPLTLRDATGTISSPDFPAPGFPALPADISYGRTSDGGLGYFSNPTPGSANTTAAGGVVEAVSFSIPHGFYTNAQPVILDTTTPGATIRYTNDGSTPTTTTGTVVSSGETIAVSSTLAIRAIAYRSGWIPSQVETRTYLFTADILDQSASPVGWPSNAAVNGQAFDYGMDPNIVDGSRAVIAASLTSIPSLSIVTDQANLTNSSTGIYVNAQDKGRAWERPASVELIDPTGAEPGFETNAGLRIRGGGSRRDNNPKHSLRLYFRDDYGDGELHYPLFGSSGVDRFESLGLATGQNGSWSYLGEDDATWVRDPWIRETQAAMGQPNTDSRYYHLYLNGLYWGLYYSQERLSGGHGVEHFGGSEQDYDIVGGNWRSAATASDGSVDGLQALYPLVADLSVTTSEFVTLAEEIDLENLADYYLLHYFSGDWDAAPMGWNTGDGPWADSNNWRSFRNRTGIGAAGKWIFFDHDSEFTLCGLASSLATDNTAPWNLTNGTVPDHQVPTPAWLHQALLTHPAYQQIFRDSVAEHMLTPGGALTDAENQKRFDAVVSRVTSAIDAEAARWGDTLGEPANDRSDWNNNIATLRQCATDRFGVLQAQLEADGLWPSSSAPAISPASGAVPYRSNVLIDAGGELGTIWYTVDGSDPRSATGTVSDSAISYGGPIAISNELTVQARVQNGSAWTPLAIGIYSLSTAAGPTRLLLNEYNAVGSSKFLGGGAAADMANGTDVTLGRVAGNGGDWFELVVLEEIDLRGWTFDVWHLDGGIPNRSASLTVRSDATELAAVKPGTIITVSEDIADDLSWDPSVNDWHINLQANSADQGEFFTAASQQNFAIDNDDTQIAVLDNAGAPVLLRTGEGTVSDVQVGSEEVFKLEATPTTSVRFDSAFYADGVSSTWGQPNVWDAGATVQDLSGLRLLMGDVNCDAALTIADALFIAQFSVSTRTERDRCPIDPATEIMITTSDVNNNGVTTIADALLLAQCTVGLSNVLCPNE